MNMMLMMLSGYASGRQPMAGYADWFELESISIGAEQRGRSVRGVGRREQDKRPIDFSVTRLQDAVSTVLARLCVEGKPLRQIVVAAVHDSREGLRYQFDDVYVSSFSISGGERPMEQVSFDAGSHKVEAPSP